MVNKLLAFRVNPLQYQLLQGILEHHGIGKIKPGDDVSEKMRTLLTVLSSKIPPDLNIHKQEESVNNVNKIEESINKPIPIENPVNNLNKSITTVSDDPEIQNAIYVKGIHDKFAPNNVTQKAQPSQQLLL